VRLNEDFTTRSKLEDLGRWHITRFVQKVSAALPAGTRVLDAGAGECAYKRFFSKCRYVAVDLAVGDGNWNWANVDVFSRLEELPVPDESFDAVLCTQVIEHLQNPSGCVRELHRALRRGGVLYLTAPMAQAEHQVPFDYFRYTSFGLRLMLEEAGFRDFQISPLGGQPARMAYELPRLMGLFPGSGLGTGRLRLSGLLLLPVRAWTYVWIKALQVLLLWSDRFDRVRNDPYGWSVIARR